MSTYHIITYGCQMNKSDSERLAYQLEQNSNHPAENLTQADLIIINICSIRETAVNRARSQIKQIKSKNPQAKLVLTGCILDQDKQEFKQEADEIWSHTNLDLTAKHKFSDYGFVPIMTGCNNYCSYCVVPYARGREKSQKPENIISKIKDLVNNKTQKIILLGQNVNSYKYESRIKNQELWNFPKLLKEITKIPGDFKVGFLTSHPKDMSDDLIEVIANNPKIFRDIHLPVQSGDNQILQKMNRKYNVEHYKDLIQKIKEKIPEARISTDIIVGFPGETEEQFQNTVQLIKDIGFSQIYVSAYSPRPQTTALKFTDNVSCEEKKIRREKILKMIKNN